MPKMSIEDAATHFGVSKEAIHNRIRRGSIESVVENGIKLVEIDATIAHTANKIQTKKLTNTNYDDKYYKFLEEQNSKLQEKVEKLEGETRTLRDQKEQMLIEERIKIEEIYKQKDEQLKNILGAISSKFMLNTPMPESLKEGHVEAEIDEEEEIKKENQFISLKKYLKENDFSPKKQEKIKEKFKKIAKTDKRVIVLGKKLYIDLNKHNYDDIFKEL
ncbi:MAG: DNA-binding protein [Campylobacterales bacterium]|nr:DNA-binding protein [Campylobacterales bacterium]